MELLEAFDATPEALVEQAQRLATARGYQLGGYVREGRGMRHGRVTSGRTLRFYGHNGGLGPYAGFRENDGHVLLLELKEAA